VLEIGLLAITCLVLVSLEISLIVLILKHFRNIFDFLNNMDEKYNLFLKELQGIRARLPYPSEPSSKPLSKEEPSVKTAESKSDKAIQPFAVEERSAASPLFKNQSGMPSLIRNLTEEEIPQNMKRLNILNAAKIQHGKPLEIDPKEVFAGKPGEQVQINIHTDSKPVD